MFSQSILCNSWWAWAPTAESLTFPLNRCLLCSFWRTFNVLPVSPTYTVLAWYTVNYSLRVMLWCLRSDVGQDGPDCSSWSEGYSDVLLTQDSLYCFTYPLDIGNCHCCQYFLCAVHGGFGVHSPSDKVCWMAAIAKDFLDESHLLCCCFFGVANKIFCQLPWSPRSIANVIYAIDGNMTLKECLCVVQAV